jgi:signal peptidase II
MEKFVNLLKVKSPLTRSLLLTGMIVILDQITKYWALTNLEYFHPKHVMPMLNWHLSYNQGAAFGLLANYGGLQRWFLLIIALAIASFILFKINKYKNQPEKKYETLALIMILGGAIGNFIDRLRLGYVIDFIDCYFRSWHWYTFNVADIAICLGVTLYFFVAK